MTFKEYDMHRSLYQLGALLAGPALACVALGQTSGQLATVMDGLRYAAPLPPAPGRKRGSRNPQAKPKRKSNRVTIGRRVRRKHRRAA